MELKETDYLYRGEKFGTKIYYTDVEPEAIPKEFGVRVLPAPYYFEKRLMFTLEKRYEPGEHKLFPNGGYDIRDEGGALRSYDLDQVIIHPQVFKYKKHIEKVQKYTAKQEAKRQKRYEKMARQSEKKAGKRGRRSLTPEEKAAREAITANRVKTGKRGRPGLLPEEKAAREAELARKKAISGGKRGRPKKA
jgi:hypothetical protein